jgi:hypothetical protein
MPALTLWESPVRTQITTAASYVGVRKRDQEGPSVPVLCAQRERREVQSAKTKNVPRYEWVPGTESTRTGTSRTTVPVQGIRLFFEKCLHPSASLLDDDDTALGFLLLIYWLAHFLFSVHKRATLLFRDD